MVCVAHHISGHAKKNTRTQEQKRIKFLWLIPDKQSTSALEFWSDSRFGIVLSVDHVPTSHIDLYPQKTPFRENRTLNYVTAKRD